MILRLMRGINKLRSFVPVGAIFLPAILTACGGAGHVTAAALNASYEMAIRDTAQIAVEFEAGGQPEQRALERLEQFFAVMTEQTVSKQTALVYAADAYLNDNIAAIRGAEAIEGYFLATVRASEKVEVRFIDVARSGSDYYVRWEMKITSSALNDGEPIRSFGVTQFRFDDQGRVLLHKDFWDSVSGLYEFLPVAGSMLKWLREAIEPT